MKHGYPKDECNLDGSIHRRSGTECICANDICPMCGGNQYHSEAVYGPSFIYECLDCGYDDEPQYADEDE